MQDKLIEVDGIEPKPHPARYSDELLGIFVREVIDHNVHTLLDPFAGTGKVYELGKIVPGLKIEAVEIEAEWCAWDNRITQGDATDLPFESESFDCVLTSPTYGNRMGDRSIKGTITKADGTRVPNSWRTYSSMIGRKLHPNNTGFYQWSSTRQKLAYCDLHCRAWAEAWRVLKPGGILVLNSKDHYRGHTRQRVTLWHRLHLLSNGFELVRSQEVLTPSYGYGQNGDARADYESVITFRKKER